MPAKPVLIFVFPFVVLAHHCEAGSPQQQFRKGDGLSQNGRLSFLFGVALEAAFGGWKDSKEGRASLKSILPNSNNRASKRVIRLRKNGRLRISLDSLTTRVQALRLISRSTGSIWAFDSRNVLQRSAIAYDDAVRGNLDDVAAS